MQYLQLTCTKYEASFNTVFINPVIRISKREGGQVETDLPLTFTLFSGSFKTHDF